MTALVNYTDPVNVSMACDMVEAAHGGRTVDLSTLALQAAAEANVAAVFITLAHYAAANLSGFLAFHGLLGSDFTEHDAFAMARRELPVHDLNETGDPTP